MKSIFLAGMATALLIGCNSEKKINWLNIEKDLQTQLIMAEDGDTINIPEGYFKFTGSISLDEKNNIVIAGAGIDKTFLSFKGQTEGAEGLKITNGNQIVIQDLTVQDTKGDAIKTQDITGISFLNVRTTWSGKPKTENGAYGLYPVQCKNVLIQGCEASKASDAGIYVGQSQYVIVRNSIAHHNVAGIEIENTLYADVYDNRSYHNTGGVLVFDLPGLKQPKGGYVRVFNNKIEHNNLKNFAPPGNVVASVPAGTGMMIMATSNVEVFNNTIIKNKTANASVVSYHITGEAIKDSIYDPYPKNISVHDNELSRGWFQLPDWRNNLGKLLLWKFLFRFPNIIYDGNVDPMAIDENNNIREWFRICFQNNTNASFANVDFKGGFKNISKDITPHQCLPPGLSEVKFQIQIPDSLKINIEEVKSL
jgi:parallel beta-helix repeat protein